MTCLSETDFSKTHPNRTGPTFPSPNQRSPFHHHHASSHHHRSSSTDYDDHTDHQDWASSPQLLSPIWRSHYQRHSSSNPHYCCAKWKPSSSSSVNGVVSKPSCKDWRGSYRERGSQGSRGCTDSSNIRRRTPPPFAPLFRLPSPLSAASLSLSPITVVSAD